MKIEEHYNLAKDNLNGRLFAPYQREGVLWMLTMENQESGPKGGFLCDEMGLGKTVQVVSAMLGNFQKSTLIIVPKSIITQWVNEIAKFAPQMSVHVFDGPDRKLKEADVVIMPYSLLSTHEDTPIHKKIGIGLSLMKLMRFVTRNQSYSRVYTVSIPRSSGLLQVHLSSIQWKILCLFVISLVLTKPLFRG